MKDIYFKIKILSLCKHFSPLAESLPLRIKAFDIHTANELFHELNVQSVVI